MFDDLAEDLFFGKQAYEYIHKADEQKAYADMEGHCTWVIDWFQENLPLEDRDGTALDGTVRKMVASACYHEAGPTPKEEIPKKEDILIFADQAGLCQRVLELAPEGRVGTKKILTKPVSMLGPDDVDNALGTKTWDLIVVGSPLDPPQSSKVVDVITQQNHVAKFMLALLQKTYLKDGSCKRMAVLTHDIFSSEEETNQARGLAGITNATMYGLCNTARQEVEYPVHLIDTELVDDTVMYPYIMSEIFRSQTFGVNTVRLCYPWPVKNGIATGRPAGRYVIRQLPSFTYELAERPFVIPEEGTIGISGGNGALGLVMGEWLLNTAEKMMQQSGGSYTPKFTILFLSRSMKISDINIARWKDIQVKAESLGVKVEQSKVDMGSQEAVDSWISQVTPNLIGFIHSAGVLRDSMLPNQTWQKFEEVYDGKHRAALYIHDSLERFVNPNLKFFWLFSSTSVYGNMGQLNYSSSNSFMDALSRWRISQGKPCCAIQWGAWGEVGMAATMDDAMRRRVMMGPMPYFTVAQGLQGLEGGLRTGLPGFSVFIVNPPMMGGMVYSDQSVMANFTRNFYCEYVPVPWPSTADHASAYNLYRSYRHIMDPYANSGTEYYWNKIVKPYLKDEEEEEDNHFAELAMF